MLLYSQQNLDLYAYSFSKVQEPQLIMNRFLSFYINLDTFLSNFKIHDVLDV